MLKPRQIDFLPSRIAIFDHEEYLFFSGTAYLGIGHQPLFRDALMQGIDRYGTVFSASRNNNLQLKIYEEAEDFFAKWTHAEAALTLSSGLLAGQLAVHFLKEKHFIYAPSTHPALWNDTPQYIFENQQNFEKRIVEEVEKQQNKSIVIATNTIDMLTCQTYNFNWIAQLPDNQDITLLIDDSHGIGITGEKGSGIFKKIKYLVKSNIKIIVIASLAKALGLPGGVILSDKLTIKHIRQNPLFVGASPIIPAYLYAFLKTQNMYENIRQILFNNIHFFKNMMKNSLYTEGVHFPIFQTPLDVYPVFYTSDNNIYMHLFKQKIFISHFAYPKPSDPPITRIILSALHSESDILQLHNALKSS